MTDADIVPVPPADNARFRLWVDVAQIVTAIVAVIGILFTGWQAMALRQALDRTDRQNNLAAWTAVTQQALALDDIFIERPLTQKYFYDGAPIPADPAEAALIRAIAVKVVDTFENIADIVIYMPPDRTTVPGQSIGRREVGMFYREAWENYIVDTFRSSPAACEVVALRGHQYDEALNTLAERGCRNQNERRPSPIRPEPSQAPQP